MKTWAEISTVQPLASRILANSLQKKRISHAYLIEGDRGTGKEEISLLLAKSLFCKQHEKEEPCYHCKDCQRIASGNHPDLHVIIPEGQSIKKEQILHLQKEFTYTGMESNQKVYIIHEADKMTTNASNRLLKFLEEPSKQTTAILLTTNSQAILPTIRSRCQMLTLKPLNPRELQKKLEEEGLTESTARITAALTNSLTEAVEISNEDWFANARKLVVQLVEVLQTKPDESILFLHNQWMPHFKEREQLQRGLDLLILWFKDMIYHYIGSRESIVFLEEQEKLEEGSMYWSRQQLTEVLRFLLEAKRKLDQNVHPVLVMEQLTLQAQR